MEKLVYMELDDIKKRLDEEGIKYVEERPNHGILLYVTESLNGKKIPKGGFDGYVRISQHDGQLGYYVRYCGVIYDNISEDNVIRLIRKMGIV